MMDVEKIMHQLKNPFPPEDIEWRVGSTTQDKSKGLALAYITNRAIQNRLDEVFGVFGWRNEFKEWKGVSQLCGISVKFEGEWITKWDGADDSATEAVKGGLSDSMKRAAYQWGIGRYLYKLPQTWVKLKPQGKSYAIDQVINLPQWALPSDYKEPMQTPIQQIKTAPQATQAVTTLISEDQRKQLSVIAKELGLSGEDMVNIIKFKYKKSNSKELTGLQGKYLISNLNEIWSVYIKTGSVGA